MRFGLDGGPAGYSAGTVQQVLVLNASYEPLNVCSLRRAHVLVYKGKAEVIEELDKLAAEAGVPLIHLALAFVINHPAVSAAIIGPRTMEQLDGQLAAPECRLDDDVLDRIDELVPPGTNLNAADGGYQPPAIASAWRRRRPR